MSIDYTRSEIDILIDLIRRDNQNKPLTTGQVTFATPNVFSPTPTISRNTQIVASAIPKRGYKGNQTFYYNRVKLPDFIPPSNPQILYFEETQLTKLSQLLPEINERLQTNIGVDKIVERNLPVFAFGDTRRYAEVLLTMKNNSLVYIDQVSVRIVRDDIDLVEAIPDNEMDGLVYTPPA